MTNFAVIDLTLLTSVTGGQAGAPDAPEKRTWGQVGKEYASACIAGAGQQLMFSGMPSSFKGAALTAAAGCAMGVGMKAIEDGTTAMFGGRA